MSELKISVIISTYNRPHYLAKVLEGFMHQTKRPMEIIVADDGSKEDTSSVIKSFQEKSEIPIVHVWHEDKGFRLAQIRNKAIAKSSGEYLVICDDDSIPDKHFIEDHNKYKMMGSFIQGHRVLLGPEISKIFNYRMCSFNFLVKYIFSSEVKNISNSMRPSFPLIRISQGFRGIRGCNMSFYKKDILAVNGYNEDFIGWGKEDSELAVRFYNYGLKRKDIKFRLPLYHLYHEEFSRNRLEQNTNILEIAMKNGSVYCENGIDKYLK